MRKILEVGPGTGAVTREIIRAMGPEDRLELVELNDQFVAHLAQKLVEDPAFSAAADRVTLIHAPVQQLDDDAAYDLIISGLPLNNFSVDLVQDIVSHLGRLAAPGCTLSFFEYIAIRRSKAVLSSRAERARLRQIGMLLDEFLEQREIRRDRILRNVPPAWVHHVRF